MVVNGKAEEQSSSAEEESESESGEEEDTSSGSEEESDVEEDEDSDDDDDENAKRNSVQHDLAAMQQMMVDMDKIKMRLEFRLAQEREAQLEVMRQQIEIPVATHVEEITEPMYASVSVQTDMEMSDIEKMEMAIEAASSARKTLVSSTGPLDQGEKSESHAPNAFTVDNTVRLSLHDLAKEYSMRGAGASPTKSFDIPNSPASNILQHEIRTSAASKPSAEPIFNTTHPQQHERNASISSIRAAEPFIIKDEPHDSSWPNPQFAESANRSFAKSQDSILNAPSRNGIRQGSVDHSVEQSLRNMRSSLMSSIGEELLPSRLSTSDIEDPAESERLNYGNSDEKTMQQREMEAIQSLLFNR